MPSLAIAPIALALAFQGQGFVPARFGIAPLQLTATFPEITLGGTYGADLGALVNTRFDRLQASSPITLDGKAAHPQFRQFWETHCRGLEVAIRALANAQINDVAVVQGLVETQAALSALVNQILGIQTATTQQETLQRVRDSYSDSNILTASNASGVCSISIAAHERHYLDPMVSVPVNAGVIGGLGAATTYYVYYDDETLSGGAVTYQASMDNAQAVASLTNPYRHAVGLIETPTNTGGGSTGGSNIPPWKQVGPDL